MDEQLIANWNQQVGEDDTVFHLGDFALANKNRTIEIGQRLNGKKYLILGNHDTHKIQTYYDAGFKVVSPYPIIIDDFIVLSHEPQYVAANGVYGHIFGHVHDNPSYTDYSSKTFCVCVERIGYKPISYAEILEKIKVEKDRSNQ